MDTMTLRRQLPGRVLRGWPAWAAPAAATWSGLYGMLGLYWTLGGGGFPFGAGDVQGVDNWSLLAGAHPDTTGPVIAVLGLAAAAVALRMARPRGGGMRRLALLAIAWGLAAGLTVVVPDLRLIKHLPPLGVFALGRLDWPALNLLLVFAGGLLWGMTALGYQRATRHACGNCGRAPRPAGCRAAPAAPAPWGRWVTYLAVAAPLPYAVSRFSWALGVPLGVPGELMEHFAPLALFEVLWASLACGGAVLTLGLLRPWGERWPRWVVGVAGKPVPLWFPVAFAAVVAFSLTAAGMQYWRQFILSGGVIDSGDATWGALSFPDDWGFFVPSLAWLVWGVALGLAAVGYYLRRRGRCTLCGQG